MASGVDLFQAVAALLASGRLGEPVFARCLLLTPDPAVDSVQQLAQLAGIVRGWFGVPLHRLYTSGTAREGQVSVTLQFANGATALIACARCPETEESLDLLLLGNHGAA